MVPSTQHGKTSVILALSGNAFLTIIKVAAALFTHSASMFAESIHSFADTLNQSLLLVGLQRSKKPADTERGYGYGTERFFWSLISACGILFVGAGVTIYHSIETLLEQQRAEYLFNPASIIILCIAFVIEGATLYVALTELRRGHDFSMTMFREADPVVLSVVYEDGAAVLGVVIALSAQGVSFLTHDPAYDAIGGIVIGVLLAILAIMLIRKNHHYIIGKPVHEDRKDEILAFLLTDPCIEKVLDFKSEAIDVGKYSLYVTVEWNGGPLCREIYAEGELQEEWNEIREDMHEFVRLMYKTVDRVPRLVGTHIDKVEKNVIQHFPEIAYIDIEIN